MGGTSVVTPVSLLNGLREYWKCNETTGTTVYGSLGVSNLTTNGTRNEPGIIDKSVNIISGTSIYSASNESATRPDLIDCTFSLWVTFTTLPSTKGDYAYIIFNYNNSPTPGWQNILLRIGYTSPNSEKILYILADEPSAAQHSSSSNEAIITQTDTWYHLVCGYSIGVNTIIYLNGNNVMTTQSIPTEQLVYSKDRLTFGNEYYLGTLKYLNGKVCEIGMWDRLLTQTEITQLYNSGIGLTYPFV